MKNVVLLSRLGTYFARTESGERVCAVRRTCNPAALAQLILEVECKGYAIDWENSHFTNPNAQVDSDEATSIPAAAMETAQSATSPAGEGEQVAALGNELATLKREARKTLAQAEVTGFTCTICGRTGFDKPTAHGCLNKANQWRAPRHMASARRS